MTVMEFLECVGGMLEVSGERIRSKFDSEIDTLLTGFHNGQSLPVYGRQIRIRYAGDGSYWNKCVMQCIGRNSFR